MLAPALLLVQACAAGDLAAHHLVTGTVERRDANAIVADQRLPEGAPWDMPGAVVLGRGGTITIDLGDAHVVAAVALQADNNDVYLVDASSDGTTFAPLAVAGATRGLGLRTRYVKLDDPRAARVLRITARGGDGMYSVSRVRVYCQVPDDWPSAASAWSPSALWQAIDNDSVLALKGGLAVAGALVLGLSALLAWRKRDRVLRRTRDAALAALGVLAFCAYFNFFHFHFDDFVHQWDVYHYYVGAKYFPELGYTRIYECTTVAEAEMFGRDAVKNRTIRDLVTNEAEPVAPLLAAPGRCKDHFTDARWREFSTDIAFFRNQFSAGRWFEVLHDHGYNATPVWGVAGRLLAGTGA